MKKTTKRFYIFAITIIEAGIGIYVAAQQLYKSTSNPPAFKDGGKTVEALKSAYQCKSIEFENWGEDDVSDDRLTVCLVNSPKVPAGNIEESHAEFRTIAK